MQQSAGEEKVQEAVLEGVVLDPPPQYVELAKEFILGLFPSARIDEQHGSFVRFEVPSSNLTLSAAFEAIEAAKQSLGIED